MLSADDLIGAWSLQSSVTSRNGVERATFGVPPAGQIQYSADGRMSAFLMDPEWAARGVVAADSASEFFSYGGAWEFDGTTVRHHIEYASVPKVVGTTFVRTVKPVDANTIELLTEPETTRSGAVYVVRLVWKRFAAKG